MARSPKRGRSGGEATAEQLRRFVEELARLRVAADDLENEEFRIAFAKEHRLNPNEITEEDVIAELDEERLFSETMAFWEMIRRARRLLGRGRA